MIKKSVLLLTVLTACSSPETSLQQIFRSGSIEFRQILETPSHEIQIIYGELSKTGITHHTYGVNSERFYYPASAAKLPVAVAAVHRMSELELPFQTSIIQDSTVAHPRAITYDSIFGQHYSLETALKHIFAYSDNRAYNLLFNWLGRDHLHDYFRERGITTRIRHQLSESAYAFSSLSNERSATTRLITPNADTLLFDGKNQTRTDWPIALDEKKGIGYLDATNTLVDEPMDFTEKNFVPLSDLLGIMERLVKPSLFASADRLHLRPDMRESLLDIMRLRPRALPHPIDTLPDNYVKFLMFGDEDRPSYPDHMHILNKVGWAYGYLTDVAYIYDEENDIEFFLAASIHVNPNNIYNDGEYAYETKGLPFLGELGRLIYAYELNK